MRKALNWISILFIIVFIPILGKLNLPWMSSIPWWDWNILKPSLLWPIVATCYLTIITFFIGMPIVEFLDKLDEKKYLTHRKK